MKSFLVLLLVSTLSVVAQADDDASINCNANIKRLEDTYKADGASIGGGKVEEFKSLLQQAKDARDAGDLKMCNSAAARAQNIYNTARGK